MSLITDLALFVDNAARTATAIPQLTDSNPNITMDDAYAIQALSIAQRRARGETRAGYKMGLTSRAKMVQVGVDEPIWGRLTNQMREVEGAVLSKKKYVHPRAEPEVAYLLKRPLEGKVSALEALDAVEAVAPAIEIIDSRYANFKFALPDVIADNSSSSGFYIGNWHSKATDVSNLGILLEVNGRAVQIGSTAAILGNPIRSLVMAADMVARSGERLEAGDIILAGGATAAHALSVGEHIRATFEKMGQVEFVVGE